MYRMSSTVPAVPMVVMVMVTITIDGRQDEFLKVALHQETAVRSRASPDARGRQAHSRRPAGSCTAPVHCLQERKVAHKGLDRFEPRAAVIAVIAAAVIARSLAIIARSRSIGGGRRPGGGLLAFSCRHPSAVALHS